MLTPQRMLAKPSSSAFTRFLGVGSVVEQMGVGLERAESRENVQA